VTVEGQLAIFLYIVGHDSSSRDTERYITVPRSLSAFPATVIREISPFRLCRRIFGDILACGVIISTGAKVQFRHFASWLG